MMFNVRGRRYDTVRVRVMHSVCSSVLDCAGMPPPAVLLVVTLNNTASNRLIFVLYS